MLLNVGSGGGAAAAPTGGAGTAATEAPAAEAKEEKKEEGIVTPCSSIDQRNADVALFLREGGVRRGHGLRVVRLGLAASKVSNNLNSCSVAEIYSKLIRQRFQRSKSLQPTPVHQCSESSTWFFCDLSHV